MAGCAAGTELLGWVGSKVTGCRRAGGADGGERGRAGYGEAVWTPLLGSYRIVEIYLNIT
jgi:hypothetical protein